MNLPEREALLSALAVVRREPGVRAVVSATRGNDQDRRARTIHAGSPWSVWAAGSVAACMAPGAVRIPQPPKVNSTRSTTRAR